MSRASDAHSSPLKKAGVVLSFGCVENRAEIAHTASIRTGGTVPALEVKLVSCNDKFRNEEYLPQFSHKTWLVQYVVSLSI
jgi:hypothetical protein